MQWLREFFYLYSPYEQRTVTVFVRQVAAEALACAMTSHIPSDWRTSAGCILLGIAKVYRSVFHKYTLLKMRVYLDGVKQLTMKCPPKH